MLTVFDDKLTGDHSPGVYLLILGGGLLGLSLALSLPAHWRVFSRMTLPHWGLRAPRLLELEAGVTGLRYIVTQVSFATGLLCVFIPLSSKALMRNSGIEVRRIFRYPAFILSIIYSLNISINAFIYFFLESNPLYWGYPSINRIILFSGSIFEDSIPVAVLLVALISVDNMLSTVKNPYLWWSRFLTMNTTLNKWNNSSI